MRTLLPPLALIAAVLAVGGCGSSSSKGSTSAKESSVAGQTAASSGEASKQGSAGAALSAAQLVGRADAICKRYNARIARLPNTVHNAADYAHIAPPRVALYKAALAELNKLTPPASLASDWQRMIAARAALAKALSRLAEDGATNNLEDIRPVLVSTAHVGEQIATSATQAGLIECAKIT